MNKTTIDPIKMKHGRPAKQGLYDPAHEKDSCGVGFVAHIKGKPSHTIVQSALTMLEHMNHRQCTGLQLTQYRSLGENR